MRDIMLSVSPLLLALVDELARDAAAGGFVEMHRLVAENREAVATGLHRSGGARLVDPGSRISFAWFELATGISANRVAHDLRSVGIHVVPGGSFYWAGRGDPDRFIRIALARDREIVEGAAALITDYLRRAIAKTRVGAAAWPQVLV
jgi:DNA-binding transcriptional MocR family regulator